MFGTPPTCAPYAHSARAIQATIHDIPERHPVFLDVHLVHHHHQKSFIRQAAILYGNIYFCECAVTTVGAPGPVYDLANSRACWLHDIIAVGIHTNNSSSRTT